MSIPARSVSGVRGASRCADRVTVLPDTRNCEQAVPRP
jgi:hypothetical protein